MQPQVSNHQKIKVNFHELCHTLSLLKWTTNDADTSSDFSPPSPPHPLPSEEHNNKLFYDISIVYSYLRSITTSYSTTCPLSTAIYQTQQQVILRHNHCLQLSEEHNNKLLHNMPIVYSHLRSITSYSTACPLSTAI
ncbi:hypothetical protein RRG08_057064 [Elysia crispata]|uniref:Uncharacterized protein n=1 Tax=Elysia crispata TaxID=231223 RepID=A0AAE1ALY4_9GAST|nr:hypothetical protein RRG08_057064 [Elysia crispata]